MVGLSPSKLNLLKDCHRCFYDTNNKLAPRPKGIPPATIMNGIDKALKGYVDNFRGSLPPELQADLPGVLFSDLAKVKRWRQWQTGLTYIDEKVGVKVIGALDDCLLDGDVFIPLDFKTKGFEPKSSGEQYYQLQLDCYTLMLNANGFKTDGRGFLAYYYPKSVNAKEGQEFIMDKNIPIAFGAKVFELKTDPERAKATIKEAVELLAGKRPGPGVNCEYCQYVDQAISLLSRANPAKPQVRP